MKRILAAALPIFVFSCGASQEPKPPGDACATSARTAADRVIAVAEANTTCQTDADCVSVPVGATCFDACTRPVNKAGAGAVDRASALVEANECKPFHSAGCKLIPPPCAPPMPPKCNAGHCG